MIIKLGKNFSFLIIYKFSMFITYKLYKALHRIIVLNLFMCKYIKHHNLQSIFVYFVKLNVISCILYLIFELINFWTISNIQTTQPSSFFLKFDKILLSNLNTHSYCKFDSKHIWSKTYSIKYFYLSLQHFLFLKHPF